jgi:hypothetical protein
MSRRLKRGQQTRCQQQFDGKSNLAVSMCRLRRVGGFPLRLLAAVFVHVPILRRLHPCFRLCGYAQYRQKHGLVSPPGCRSMGME